MKSSPSQPGPQNGRFLIRILLKINERPHKVPASQERIKYVSLIALAIQEVR